MGSAERHEERVDRLQNIQKRLGAIERVVSDCRRATNRLLLRHGKDIGREFGLTNDDGDIEWEAERLDSLLLSLSLSEAMTWLSRADSRREATVRDGGAGTPPAGRPPSGLAPPPGPPSPRPRSDRPA